MAKIQYLIEKSFPDQLGQNGTQIKNNDFRSTQFGILPQRINNSDILAGFADLPSGYVSESVIETYFKILALFYDHIIIPDGWLHCDGPISNYLRKKYRGVKGDIQRPEFANNIIFEFLKKGIIIPGLRGRRPTIQESDILGFDIYDVWNGNVKDISGNTISLGVNLPPEKRMAILDPNTDNEAILRSISENTRYFVDWTSPHIPVTAVCDNEKLDIEVWDTVFSDIVYGFLCDSEVRITSPEELNFLEKIGFSFNSKVFEFWDMIGQQIIDLKKNRNKIRRGTIEHLVGKHLGFERLYGYDQIYNELHSPSKESIKNPIANLIQSEGELVNPIAWFGSVILNRVTTIQEYLFSRKFNCKINNCSYLSQDILDCGLLNKLNINRDTPQFSPKDLPLIDVPINFAGLNAQEIEDLRLKHKDYFDAFANLRASENFWEENKEFEKIVKNYLRDISLKSPLNKIEKITIDLGIKAASSYIVASVIKFAAAWGAGLVIPGYGPIVMFVISSAPKSVSPISRFISGKVSPIAQDVFKKFRIEGRVDSILRLVKEHGLTRTDGEIK